MLTLKSNILTKNMTLKKFWHKHQRLVLISLGSLLALFLVIFLSSRPWQLAASLRDLEDLSSSFRRSYPCHEDCLVKRLELENRLIAAIQAKQPGLEEIIAIRAKDNSYEASFRRSLDHILKSSAYEKD